MLPVERGTGAQLMLSPCLHTDTESGADRRYMGLCGGLLGQVWPGAVRHISTIQSTVCQQQSPGACVSRRTNRYSDGQVLRLWEAEIWSTALQSEEILLSATKND